MFYWVFTGFYWDLLVFYGAGLGFEGSYGFRARFQQSVRAQLGSWLVFTGFYWVFLAIMTVGKSLTGFQLSLSQLDFFFFQSHSPSAYQESLPSYWTEFLPCGGVGVGRRGAECSVTTAWRDPAIDAEIPDAGRRRLWIERYILGASTSPRRWRVGVTSTSTTLSLSLSLSLSETKKKRVLFILVLFHFSRTSNGCRRFGSISLDFCCKCSAMPMERSVWRRPTKFRWVLLHFIEFQSIVLGFTGFHWVLLGFTGFYWVLLGFNGFYWVLLRSTEF